MKKLWNRIPRPCRAVINLAAALILTAVLYVSNGCPALSPLHQFRRIERANFVGPADILFNGKVEEYSGYSHFIVGETEHGVLTFASGGGNLDNFNYFKKTGAITVVSAPSELTLWGHDNSALKLPVFVVDGYPDAVRAQLEVSVDGFFDINQKEIPLAHTFCGESVREYEGCFRFSFDLPYLDNRHEDGILTDPFVYHGAEGFALDALAGTFTNMASRSFEVTITAVVRLYDGEGNLIAEQEQILDPNEEYWV